MTEPENAEVPWRMEEKCRDSSSVGVNQRNSSEFNIAMTADSSWGSGPLVPVELCRCTLAGDQADHFKGI